MSFATEDRSVQQKVFDSFYDKLVKTLAPQYVAAGCYSKYIITCAELEDVQLTGRTQQQMNAVLLRAVKGSIIINPDTAFSTFLEVLSTEKKYDPLVKDIRKFIKKEDKY